MNNAAQTVGSDKPEFPSAPVRPLTALRAFHGLTRDREDTRYVFAFFQAVNGRSSEGYYRRFLASEYGRRFLQDPEALGRTLTDRQTLERYGAGTFAAAYLRYLDEEKLQPLGVFEAAWANAPEHMDALKRHWPEIYWIHYNGQLTHDLFHVLTGYGRDPLGEALLLVFSGVQTGNRGARLLGALAGLRIRSEVLSWPVGRMMKEAVRLAREAENFTTADLPALLSLPLDEARAAVNIARPALYQATREAWTGPEPVAVKA